MSAVSRWSKLNKSIVKDLRKQTLEAYGRRAFRLGETAFVVPTNPDSIPAPTELVGKIVGRQSLSQALWLTLYGNGKDSFFETGLHKLILAETTPPVVQSRALIERNLYEIRPWNNARASVEEPVGHLVVQKFVTMDHEGRHTWPPDFSLLEIVLNGTKIYPKV